MGTFGLTVGGGNLTQVTTLTSGAGVGSAAVWNASATPTLENRQKTKTDVKGHLKKLNVEVSIESDLDSEALDSLLNTYMDVQADTSTVEYEDGTMRGLVTGDVTRSLVTVHYFGKNSGGKRKVLILNSEINSEGYTAETKKNLAPKVTLKGVKATNAIAVPAALFDSTLVSGAALITIAAGTMGTEIWLSAV